MKNSMNYMKNSIRLTDRVGAHSVRWVGVSPLFPPLNSIYIIYIVKVIYI